jgi:hypothetical protein
VIELDADKAVAHAGRSAVGPEPHDPDQKHDWEALYAELRARYLNGCRVVGICREDAVSSAIDLGLYEPSSSPRSMVAEVEALTAAGAQWHHTPYGVFWTDPEAKAEGQP